MFIKNEIQVYSVFYRTFMKFKLNLAGQALTFEGLWPQWNYAPVDNSLVPKSSHSAIVEQQHNAEMRKNKKRAKRNATKAHQQLGNCTGFPLFLFHFCCTLWIFLIKPRDNLTSISKLRSCAGRTTLQQNGEKWREFSGGITSNSSVDARGAATSVTCWKTGYPVQHIFLTRYIAK